jgi:hypothetical protein
MINNRIRTIVGSTLIASAIGLSAVGFSSVANAAPAQAPQGGWWCTAQCKYQDHCDADINHPENGWYYC